MSPPFNIRDLLVCRCLRVTESELLEAAAQQEFCSLADITCRTGAGDGCTCCHRRLRQFVTEQPMATMATS